MERKAETPSAVGTECRPLCQLQAGIRLPLPDQRCQRTTKLKPCQDPATSVVALEQDDRISLRYFPERGGVPVLAWQSLDIPLC